MNGRCQKDALDRAEDICEVCGNQFCAQCLLFPRGHRNPPTCKTCALANSGLRGGATKQGTLSRREYKKRKKALLEQLEGVEEQAPAIDYFELKDPSPFDRSTELDRRPAAIEEEPTIDILASEPEPEPVPPAPQVPPPPPSPPAPPVPTAEDIAPVDHQTLDGLAPVDTSVNPLALGNTPPSPEPAPPLSEPAPSEASASAADLLARLKADQPIQSQFSSAPVGLDVDPFASTQEAVTAPTPAPPSPAPAASPAPKSGTWSPPAPPPRGSNLDAMDTDAQPSEAFYAPLQTAQPGTPPGAGAAPQSAVATTAAAHAQENLNESPFGPDDTSSGQTPQRRAADTDDTGQWIPPSLRGMATPDDRDPLPKRR